MRLVEVDRLLDAQQFHGEALLPDAEHEQLDEPGAAARALAQGTPRAAVLRVGVVVPAVVVRVLVIVVPIVVG